MTKCISHHLTLIFLLQIIQVVSAQPLFLDSSEMAAGKNLTLLSVCLPHHPTTHPQPDHNALLPIPSPWSSQCTMRQRSLNTMQRISAATAEEESATLATSGVASSSDQFPSHEAETNKKLPKCISAQSVTCLFMQMQGIMQLLWYGIQCSHIRVCCMQWRLEQQLGLGSGTLCMHDICCFSSQAEFFGSFSRHKM